MADLQPSSPREPEHAEPSRQNQRAYGLFEVVGLELEYMIVEKETLSIQPGADVVLQNQKGETVDELHFSGTSWSNELVSHVIEIKTDPPVAHPAEALPLFQRDLQEIQRRLHNHELTLLGTGMHPFMEPAQMQLWPGENGSIYQTFHRIFDCSGHGWSNLQSMHINLPFDGDEEFARLMAAIRTLLPLMPALSASSPICEMVWSGYMDYRLHVYGSNARKIPSIAAEVIPEAILDPEQYRERILGEIYRDLEPHDPEGILQHEWVNGRGAIARFDRNAIEIRILDTQESCRMDLALASLFVAVLKSLVFETWSDFGMQSALEQNQLVHVYKDVVRNGSAADVESSMGTCLGLGSCNAIEAWRQLAERVEISSDGALDRDLESLLRRGSLSEALKDTLVRNGIPAFSAGPRIPKAELIKLYRGLGSPPGPGWMP